MNRRRNVPPAPPIFQLLSDREDLRQQFAYIGLAGGPSRAARSAADQLAVTIRDLDMEFTSDELESAFKFYSIHKSASEGPCNRYGNIFAFDRTAVSAPVGTTSGSDADTGKSLYLNANIVADGKGSWWAASQAPTPHTFNTYFHAILSRSATRRHDALFPSAEAASKGGSTRPKVAMIVQLTGWFDGKVAKADSYLPKLGRPAIFHPPHGTSSPPIELALIDAQPDPQMTRSTLRLSSDGGESMKLHHFLFHAWPDHGVPTTNEDIKALKQLLNTTSKLQKEEQCEVYVNCSAGIGRTGTFIALWSLLEPPMFVDPAFRVRPRSALKPLPSWASGDEVAETVDTLREQRGMMCQTQSQIEFIYWMTGLKPARP